MNKFFTYISCCLLLLGVLPSTGKAQTFEVSGGTAGSHLNTLLYTFYSTPRSQRMATHYPASQIAAGGLTSGSSITSLELERFDATGLSYPAGTATVKLYLENRPASSADLGAGTVDWATSITNATLVFSGDVGAVLGSTAGWKNFGFGIGTGTASNFLYTGGALVVYAEYGHTAGVGSSGNYITMAYATAANGTPAPNGWTTNSTKASNSSTTTPPAGMGTSSANHPHIRFNYSGGAACTAPPAVGTATASLALACPLTTINLNVNGIAPGVGLTFKWQSASTLAGPYTDISTDNINSALPVTPSTTTFYRAVVTCSGQSTATTPVQVTINPGLSAGTYTINSAVATGGSNFQTFAAAIAAMNCGILGPVVFNVDAASGPYNEQLIIPQVLGSSATNTITFNGNGRTIQAVPVSATRAMVRLEGADYVTINNLNMVTQDATYGWGVHFTDLAENNRISNCTIDVSAVTSTTQSNSAGIVASASNTSVTSTGNVARNNIISGNTIIGGYQGIIMHGNSTDRATGNSITNNNIRDFYATGVELTYHTETVLSNNDISRPNRTSVTTFAGIELGSTCNGVIVNANRIHNTHNPGASQGGTAYGIYLNGSDADAGTENLLSNNLIYDFNSGTGTQYGIYNSSSNNCLIYHNTIVLDNGSSTSGTTRGFYQLTLASGIDFKNNLITVSRAGTGTKYAIYFGTLASTITSDFNNLHVSTAPTHFTGYYNATSQLTLADWQAASAGDANSLDLAPLFVNTATGNYKPITAGLNNKGVNVSITTDIVNAPRSSATPDLGAYEFDVAGCAVPPTTGTLSATPNGILCSGTPVAFSLSGNSIGTGQTYTLQSSLTTGTGFTDIGTPLDNPAFAFTVTATGYYRVAVTCSGNTEYSNEILITVPGLFPGGTYTINNNQPTAGNNFNSFAAATAAINCGIAGPVTFNVDAASG
ncbi:MAG: right-handed parallel beta-helix repeat-containing protein, partial [Chitinophagaceae bacterium]